MVNTASMSAEQAKKQARIQISIEKSSGTLGFLHACLVKIGNRYFLFAGAPEVGKTTYGNALREYLGAEIIANDWVVVQKKDENFYASDLNYKKDLKHEQAVLLAGVIFLLPKDKLHRDAFVPNKDEFFQLLASAFYGLTTPEILKLSKFWLENVNDLPFYCAVPTKQKSVRYVTDTIILLIQKIRPKDSLLEVGVVGVGAVGVHLAAQLGQLPFVKKVHLFDHSKNKVVGYALDLNQALINNNHNLYVAHDSPEDLFNRSSSVFLTFRDNNAKFIDTSLPERWQKVQSHVNIMDNYARLAVDVRYAGNVFVITNPVDYLAFAYYKLAQSASYGIRTFQVFGLGLETDLARARYYGKRFSPTLAEKDISIYGNHSDEFNLLTNLPEKINKSLLKNVTEASREIRNHNVRTVFGPVSASVRNFLAIEKDLETNLTVLQEKAFIGRCVSFKFGLPASPESKEYESYKNILENNRKIIMEYKYLINKERKGA